MLDSYTLKNPQPNPYAERMRNGYMVIIDREPDTDDEEFDELCGSIDDPSFDVPPDIPLLCDTLIEDLI